VFIADFHIHSKYSRATSQDCIPEMLDLWARRKGLGIIGTGDFTHAAWREDLKLKLIPAEEGLYTLKDEFSKEEYIPGENLKPRFLVSGEISSIYKKNGKVRKVHSLILLPGLEEAEALSHKLESIGNLHSDGRPILGLDCKDLLEITLEVCSSAIFIPAHIWTPHFSVFGAYSGFDDIRECFEDLTEQIFALETGLSSDPPMNWRISALDRYTLVSNSDAHSPANLAREANLFNTDLSYRAISRALQNRNTGEFPGTIEFFPEEGKYHYDGHRNCKVCLKPEETRNVSGICPVCGSKLIVGVLHRVEELADRREGFVPPAARQYQSLVPLPEVIAASIGLSPASGKVKQQYLEMIQNIGPELFILREAELSEIELKAGLMVAEGIHRLRTGKVEKQPGYDGEYGKISVLNKEEIDRLSGQLVFFPEKDKKGGQKKVNRKYPVHEAHVPGLVCVGKTTENTIPSDSHTIFYGLNREQRDAVSASDPVIAVIAGPGTGKTRTLISRIVYLIEQCRVPPSQIIAVTFTNRAAADMRTRLAAQISNDQIAKAITIGTFHSICLKVLTDHTKNAGITIIDEYDSLSIVEETLQKLQLKESPRDTQRKISLIKSGVQISNNTPTVPVDVYETYNQQLERYGVIDYDDILLKTLSLFEDGGDILTGPGKNPVTHLLVDEFQDINDAQYRLIKEWGKNCNGIFLIGDPDQSIYGFRGSDARCFDRIRSDYPQMREIQLVTNYRSTPEIVNCARSFIAAKNSGFDGHGLQAERKSGVRVRVREVINDFSEAMFIARSINQMVGGIDMLDTHRSPAKKEHSASSSVRSFSDIAVLYRTNHQAEVLEQCLLQEGIPYTIAGRNDFLLDFQVRKTVAFFRFILNPGDLFALRSYLKTVDDAKPDFSQKVLNEYIISRKGIIELSNLLRQHLPSSSDTDIRLLEKYSLLAKRQDPAALIDSWIIDNEPGDKHCLERLSNMASFHEAMSGFLQNLILGQESDIIRNGKKNYRSEKISLMTLHGSKGLEFPVVFLCGVREGLIPLQNRGSAGDPDEERRLFYVGMTRAQDELVLLTSGKQSPFLKEIPDKHLVREKAVSAKIQPLAQQMSFFS